MEPADGPLDGRAWFRDAPTAATILTGLLGGAGAGFLSAAGYLTVSASIAGTTGGSLASLVLFALIGGFVGAFFGIIGGLFATAGSLLARGITRLVTRRYRWEATSVVAGAVLGIVAAAYVLVRGDWLAAAPWVLLSIGLAAVGFTVLVIIRRPERAGADVDA